MKKLLLNVMLLVCMFAVTAKADIFSPIDAKVKVESQFQTSLDTGSILADATTIINYLGVKEGYAYNFELKQFDNTVGATIVTYAPWGISADLEMLNADGVAGVVAWNVGSYIPVANVPLIKYFTYLYIDGGCGMEANNSGTWKIAPTAGVEEKFSF